jgi:hypothetical protein
MHGHGLFKIEQIMTISHIVFHTNLIRHITEIQEWNLASVQTVHEKLS